MKKLSKLLAVVLAVAMILAFAVPASAATSVYAYAQNPCLMPGQSTQIYFTDGSIPRSAIVAGTVQDQQLVSVTQTGQVTSRTNKTGYVDLVVMSTSGASGTVRIFLGSYPSSTVMGGTRQLNVGQSVYLSNYTLYSGGKTGTADHGGTSDPTVATVDYYGRVTGVGDGTCTLYLINERNGITGSVQIRVGTGVGGISGIGTGSGTGTGTVIGNGAMLVSSNIAVNGQTSIMSTNGGAVTITSNTNENVVRVSGSGTSTVTLTGLSAGTATLSYISIASGATSSSGIGMGTFTVTVGSGTGTGTGATITSQSIQVGGTATILATSGVISYAQSGSPTVASVTTSGGLATVRGLRAGTATITYMTSTGAQGSFTVTVGGSSTTNPDLPNVTPQGTYEMEVGGTKSLAFANTNVARVETSDSSIATGTTYTSSSGKIGARFTGKKAGTCIGYLYTSSGSVSAVNLVVTGDGEVDIDPDDAIGRVGTIQSGDPDLRVVARTSASSSASRKATLSNGVKVTVTGESGSYYQVTFSSSGKSYSGYVKKIYVDF